ncbi:MAG: D-aminoacyl-tRNA deacylase [Bryobacteraceae bacterium]|jgi:D-tyrosyl-tRNA(Tyr) deacylase
MRLLIQRVSEASVLVGNDTVAGIRTGLLVLIGIKKDDGSAEADFLLEKATQLRIFPDENGKMNKNLIEARGAMLIVSQFTLYGNCRKGRRPSFDLAAPPERARYLYDYFVAAARGGPAPVECGVFQSSMQVRLVNDGPVTLWLDSDELQKPQRPVTHRG